MAKERKMNLMSLDDLFTTQEERDNADLEKIVNISINDIDDFPEHPFKVIENEELQEMVESIKDKGVLVPAIVRKKEDGRYEMISGHRRKRASQLAEQETIPCIVRELADDEATIIMVDSNMQREKILPSEKAFAYKMKLEAISHQGKKFDTTYAPVEQKLVSREIVAEEVGESREQIRRYIRLTYLIPELLDMVDTDKVAFRPAVELSYLKKEEQESLLDFIEYNDCTPSLSQSIRLKKLSQENKLDVEEMEEIMDEEKPNQTPKLRVSMNRLSTILPPSLKNDREREEYILKAVEYYRNRELAKQKSQER